MYYFNNGRIESFEKKLQDAQEVLIIDPQDYSHITIFLEMIKYQELLIFAPIYYWFSYPLFTIGEECKVV